MSWKVKKYDENDKQNPSFSNESKGHGFQVLYLLLIIQVDKKTFFLI